MPNASQTNKLASCLHYTINNPMIQSDQLHVPVNCQSIYSWKHTAKCHISPMNQRHWNRLFPSQAQETCFMTRKHH